MSRRGVGALRGSPNAIAKARFTARPFGARRQAVRAAIFRLKAEATKNEAKASSHD